MARGFRQHDPERDGTLEVEEVHPNVVEVFFVPPHHSLRSSGLDPAQAKAHKKSLQQRKTFDCCWWMKCLMRKPRP